jgi:hypothetical protein
MKKITTGALLIGVFLICFACNSSTSEKGKWDDIEKKIAKEKFVEAMKKQLTEQEQPIDDNIVNDIAECWVNKLEATFTNLSEANDNSEKREELSDNCVREILMPTSHEEKASNDSMQTAQ